MDTKAIDYLINQYRLCNIQEGDTLLVHSSLSAILRFMKKNNYEISPQAVLDSIIISLGENGTLLLPTFDIRVSEVVYFDIANSRSTMGVLTETARVDKRFKRTRHPLLSFAVYGKHAQDFMACDDYTGIGHKSVFARLLNLDGKISVFNLKENDSMSFYHHVEFMLDVDYRWIIPFEAEITFEDGVVVKKPHAFYARRRDEGIVTNVEGMGDLLWKQGKYHGCPYGVGLGIRTIKCIDVFQYTAKTIVSGNAMGMLYEVQDNPL